jgi:hypothetical protein
MERRPVLAALGAVAIVLAGVAGLAAWADDKPAGKADAYHDQCAKACADCMQQCEKDFHHCAHCVTEGKKEYARAMNLCADCGDLCGATAKLCARHSSLSVPACEACAKGCDACAQECEKFKDDESMKACAKSCRDCARECREMIKHAGHSDK